MKFEHTSATITLLMVDIMEDSSNYGITRTLVTRHIVEDRSSYEIKGPTEWGT